MDETICANKRTLAHKHIYANTHTHKHIQTQTYTNTYVYIPKKHRKVEEQCYVEALVTLGHIVT